MTYFFFRQIPTFVNVASRLRAAARRSIREQQLSADRRRFHMMMDRAVGIPSSSAHRHSTTTPGVNSTSNVVSNDLSSAATLAISRSIQTSSMGSGTSLNRIRFLTDLTGTLCS